MLPGSPPFTAPTQDEVNTVGPVPMTSGYGPNTFPHSAAHVLNTNNIPSPSEGDLHNSIHTSAAMPQNLSGLTKIHELLNFSGVKTTFFTGSDLRELSNQNKDDTKNSHFTVRYFDDISLLT